MCTIKLNVQGIFVRTFVNICLFRPQQENLLPNRSQACAIIWQFILNVKRKWQLLIRFEHLLAVHFHCVLPVEVNLFLALYFHAIPGPLSWFKVKFCFIISKNASTLPWELASIHLYTVSLRIVLWKAIFFNWVLLINTQNAKWRQQSKNCMFVHCILMRTSKLK